MAESISAIKEVLEHTKEEELGAFCEAYAFDERAGVQNLIKKAKKQMEALEAEKQRIALLWTYEKQYPDCELICGIDEVGRGPLAGPVVAGAVILPKDCKILYINDSKKLSEKKREELYDVIAKEAVSAAVGVVSPKRIDEINILQATYEAMRQAIKNLAVTPDILLNDAVTIPQVEIPQVPIIKGDAKSISIGAASIYAKVTRDRMMVEYAALYPGYEWEKNKGYGSNAHYEGIRKYGITPIHRLSFLKKMQEDEGIIF